jgi:hypothetical protein
MMEILLAVVLLAAVFAILGYPLYRSTPHLNLSSAGTLNDLLAQRDGLYATLRDLDLDYQLGKLDSRDYRSNREQYLARAAALLQQLDGLRGADAAHQNLSDEIEQEVLALRRRPSLGSPRPAAGNGLRPPAVPVVSSPLACKNCGRAYGPADRFCAKCGQALS